MGSGPTPHESTEYALPATFPGDSRARHRRQMVFLIPVLAALLSAIVAVLIFDRAGAARATGGVAQGFLLSIVAGFGLVALVLAVLMLGPGAKTLVWEPGGFRLEYSSGKRHTFQWSNRELRIKLRKDEGISGVCYDLVRQFPERNPLTAEVYGMILSEAQARGLSAKERQYAELRGRVTVTTIAYPR
jgi:hypothetical protein